MMRRSIEPDHLVVRSMDRKATPSSRCSTPSLQARAATCVVFVTTVSTAVIESRPLAEEDIEAGVVKDEIVQIGMASERGGSP